LYDLLPYAEFVYNNTKQSSILMSPYKALTRSDINFYPEASPKTNIPTLNERIELVQVIYSKLCNNLRRATKFQKSSYDKRSKNRKNINYLGMYVWII
jgi:hypothetical protein